MKMHVTHSGDIVILKLVGDLVLGDGDESFKEAVDELLGEGWRRIVVDLERVGRLDSSGTGELVAAWKLARRVEAEIHFVRPSERVKRTLHTSQLLPLLPMFDHLDEAVTSFPASPASSN